MTSTARKAIRLSPPMLELLTDIATKPQMFIANFSRWDRTARALIARGLAAAPLGFHRHQYELRITAEGRAEAARRGIGAPPETTQHDLIAQMTRDSIALGTYDQHAPQP